jgi:hypothetical protein
VARAAERIDDLADAAGLNRARDARDDALRLIVLLP